MTLHLLVLVEGKKLDERLEEAGIDDRGFICGMDRNVTDTCSGGENKGKVRGVKQSEEWFKPIGFDDLELVFLCTKPLASVYQGLITWIRPEE